MWLKFVLFNLLHINVFTFGDVVTLKKGSLITCAATQNKNAIYLDPPDQNVTLVSKSRYLTYIDPEVHKTGWILRNATELIIDKRWEDFKLMKKNNVSFRHFSSPVAFSVYSFDAINMVLYEKKNKIIINQSIMENISDFKRWHHFIIRLENKNLTIFEETTRLKTTSLNNSVLHKLQLFNEKKQDSYWKIHKYSHYFSETVSQANEKPLNLTFFSVKDKEKICVKIYMKLKKNCILLMKLNEEIISNVTSSKELWQLRSWSLLTKEGTNTITFHKNANFNITNKFWAFQIHSISQQPCQNYEIYGAKSHSNETCRTLSTAEKKRSINILQPGILADGLTCENILGDKLETCQRHKIYFEASNKYRCAWGYKPPNCQKECDNGTYGIDCKKKCQDCKICNHINGSCYALQTPKESNRKVNVIQTDNRLNDTKTSTSTTKETKQLDSNNQRKTITSQTPKESDRKVNVIQTDNRLNDTKTSTSTTKETKQLNSNNQKKTTTPQTPKESNRKVNVAQTDNRLNETKTSTSTKRKTKTPQTPENLDVNLDFIQADDKFVLLWTHPPLSSNKLTVYNVEINGFNFNQTYNTSETKYHISLKKDIYNVYNITVKAMDGLIGEIRAKILPSVLEQSKPSIEICRNSSCHLKIANAAENYSLYDLNCSIKFEPTNVVSLVANSNLIIKYRDRFYCLESNSQNEDYEKSNVQVFVVTTVLLIAVILFATYLIFAYKFSKFPFDVKVPSRRNRFEKTDIGEVKLIMKENDESKVIKLAHLENYLLDSTEGDIGDNELARQFQRVPKVFHDMPREAGMMAKNKRKNRYNALLPYDATRVVLKTTGGASDYINANYIDGYKSKRAYIATQAPTFDTTYDFWRMVYQENVSMILMITQLQENGVIKSEKYWPELQQVVRIKNINVKTVQVTCHQNYTERVIELLCKNIKRTIHHLQFISWPDHGVPLFYESLIPFMDRIMEKSKPNPTVVHCNAGCGRTGTIILCDIAIRMAAAEGVIDFYTILKNIRRQRLHLVNSLEQYVFAHLFVLEYIKRRDFSIPFTQNFKNDISKFLTKTKIQTLMQRLEISSRLYEKTRITQKLFLSDVEKSKNRFSTILPLGHSRVKLCPIEDSDYINAIYVDCYKLSNKFIVTQQPLSNTVEDFWRLVMEHGVHTILSLNEINEESEFNWPIFWPEEDDAITLGSKVLKLIEKQESSSFDLLKINLSLKDNSENKIINFINAKNWKKQTPHPVSVNDLLLLRKELVNKAWDDNIPIIVTCYDGCTASGLLVALAFVLEKLEAEGVCDIYSVCRIVKQSRRQFLQNPVQVEFLYKAVVAYVEDSSLK